MALAPGTRLGPYEVVSALGKGGMGEVYTATDTRLGRAVAIKVLPGHVASNPDLRARFDREAKALAAISHPHICAIHDVGSQDGTDFLVMEYLEGETLTDALVQGPLPLDQSLRYAIQVADALDKAHRCGIVHRDLKPGNIMLTRSGAQLLDFGLAKLQPAMSGAAAVSAAPTVTSPLTGTGSIVGTFQYMAPEQLEGEQADARSDIFSFGAVLYEMLAGRKAFAGKSQAGVIGAILKDEPPPLAALGPTIPRALDRLLRICLAKKPDDRWQSAGDLARELRWIEETGSHDVPASNSGALPAAGSGRRKVRVALLGGLALVLGTLAFVFGWLWSGRFSSPQAVVALSVFPPAGTTFPPSGPWPRVSPDGRTLVFVAVSLKGQQQLWLRRLNATTARAIPGTDGALRPFWAPSSQSIAFFANGELRRVDLDTGSIRTLTEAPYAGGMAGSWGNDVIVFKHIGGIYRVPVNGGPRSFVIRDTETTDVLAPDFLPDGRRFLYTTEHVQTQRRQACVASVDSDAVSCGADVPSTATFATPGYIVSVRNRSLQAQRFDLQTLAVSGEPVAISDAPIELETTYLPLAFSSGAGVMAFHAGFTGGQSLAWFDRAGTPLGGARLIGSRPALSPDERWIVIQREGQQNTNRNDLWLYDRTRNVETRFTFDAGDDTWPRFSPDGESVVYLGTRNGRTGFYEKRTSGDSSETLVLETAAVNPDWAPDGRFILFQRSGPQAASANFDLWAVPRAGDRKPFVVVGTEHGEREGRFSPDSRWIAYDSTESGRREVWIQPFPPTGSRWQISTEGGVSPQWRHDGKELFFVGADGTLNAASIDMTRQSPVWEKPRALFRTIYQGGTYASYAPSRDGQRFLIGAALPVEEIAPIILEVNWTARLTP